MNEYIELLKLFKVANQNIQILHRNLIGANWFGDHEQLGEYYEHVQNDIDAFCETGNSFGVIEPTMSDALNSYAEIEIKDRNSKESYEIVSQIFNDIIAQINRIVDVPADVINKLQEAQIYYRVNASFKIARAIKE